MRRIGFVIAVCAVSMLAGCKAENRVEAKPGIDAAPLARFEEGSQAMANKVDRSDEEWRKSLTPEQYRVLRQKGTERVFTGAYWNEKQPGQYVCAACGQKLFNSDTKFDSGCGWPSFFKPAAEQAITEQSDHSHGMVRTEVVCSRCGGHLGHVFTDGPQPTGLRYCINSASLKLIPEEGAVKPAPEAEEKTQQDK